ncbi:TetR/AcrR family transcriptional regulator [Microbacterium sp. WCS2018Hpa-9]|uniref:TetR/AcrR family transcriptional regulator n=1 Tax=Microbacterium sp. WCS2018Hpa-9 TaxID=3073635 RepID=UPI00288B8B21|nr:TetR/AcrR family transcriptional regulator [Microbacterium sp. WCS2018Hpa-9]
MRRSAAETQQQIVGTAVEQIAEVGFHKMSIADVAAASGISQSGLLHHFPSKVALLAAILEQRERDDNGFLFGDGTVPLGWDAFEALVPLTARNSTRPEWVGVFVRVSAEATEPDHPANEWLRDHYASARAWLGDAVEQGKQSGVIRADAPTELLVGNTIAVLDGIQQQWLVDRRIDMVSQVSAHIAGLRVCWELGPSSS